MDTPLLNALRAYAGQDPARFHMPGHKGRTPKGLRDVFPLDVTELPATGDLYRGDDVIARAEELWGELFGFPTCQFLTNGSTQGIHTALLLAAPRGRDILVDRCAHRAVYNAMALCGLNPAYFRRTQDVPVDPDLLRQSLEQARAEGMDVKTVCITSPTYYGVLSDVPALAEIAHSFGALLVVDGAHGCHLPFLGENPFRGADLLVTSAHKTMPVLGQGALLFAGDAFSPEEVRRRASVNGTSSPSYAVMASLDLARAAWSPAGTAPAPARTLSDPAPSPTHALSRLTAFTQGLRRDFPALSGVELDPLRFTALVPNGAGFEWKTRLEQGFGVYPEMADPDHLVFLLSPDNSRRDLARLRRGLTVLYRSTPPATPAGAPPEPRQTPLRPPSDPRLPPLPPLRLTPRQALFAPTVRRVLALSEGYIAAQQVAPYPPGIPVIAPGEEITKKCLAYLAQVGYNVEGEVEVIGCPPEDLAETP